MTKEYVMQVGVFKANGSKYSDHIIVKANCFNDAKIEAEHKALDLTNGQQRVISLGIGYELQVGGGCHW